MNVILATDFYYPNVSGVSVFVHRLAVGLRRQGHDVVIIAPSDTGRFHEYRRDGISVYGLPSAPVPTYRWLRVTLPFLLKRRIRQIVQDFRPEVIHIQGHFVIGQATLSVAQRLGVPTVGTNHFVPENLLPYFPRSLHRAARWWLAETVRVVFGRYSRVTTPTQTAAELLCEMGGAKRIAVISNGIDRSVFYPQPSRFLQHQYQAADRHVFLYVGRLDRDKQIGVALRALSRVPEASLVVVGQGVDRPRLECLAVDLGIAARVVFTGFVEDRFLPEVYRCADCFVMPSLAELQSIATMEAMASGLPVIAARALALPELVRDGQNGFLFRPGDEKELADKMHLMVVDQARRRAMGQASLELISAHDSQRVTQQYVALYRELTPEPSPELASAPAWIRSFAPFLVVGFLLILGQLRPRRS